MKGALAMPEIDVSTITLCAGQAVRIRALRSGKKAVEGWNGAAWVRGPDAVDWADGRPATRQELKALGIQPPRR